MSLWSNLNKPIFNLEVLFVPVYLILFAWVVYSLVMSFFSSDPGAWTMPLLMLLILATLITVGKRLVSFLKH